MNIRIDDLKKLKKFSSDSFNTGGHIYQFNDDKLYKIVGEYVYCDEVERNIDFQLENHIPHVPVIYDKLCINDEFCGYVMEYLKNSFTFRNGIGLSIDFDSCVKAILDIYEVIRCLHDRDILIGDIHMDNFLMNNKGDGYVVDLDYMMFPGDEGKFDDFYYIKLREGMGRISVDDKRTDNIKAMICCLSLMLGIDLEKKYINRYEINIENMYNNCIVYLGISSLDRYFNDIMNDKDVEYFDEFLKNNYYDFRNNTNFKARDNGLHNKK